MIRVNNGKYTYKNHDRVVIHSLGSGYPKNFEAAGEVVGLAVDEGGVFPSTYIVKPDVPNDLFMYPTYDCFAITEACLRPE